MRPERLYLQDIIDAADSVASFVAGIDRQRFVDDDLLRSAVLHKLTVVGEAAGRLSAETRAANPAVPWPDVVGFRNIAVHAYLAVDWAIVWMTATHDLPAVRSAAVRMLASSGA